MTSIISPSATKMLDKVLAEHGLTRAHFTITEKVQEPKEIYESWWTGEVTLRSTRTPVSKPYQVMSGDYWVTEFSNDLKHDYFGFVLRPRVRHKG